MRLRLNCDCEHNESEFEDLKYLDTIEDVETLEEKIGGTIILNRYPGDKFSMLQQRITDIAVMCWGFRDQKGRYLHKHPVQFKCDVDDEVVYTLPLNRFMFSLAFLRPIIKWIEFVDINDFLVIEALTDKRRKEIVNNITETLASYGYSQKEMLNTMADVSLDIKLYTKIFGEAVMPVFTAENLMLDHYRECKEFRDLNNTTYPQSMQTAEIVAKNKEKYQELEKIMTERNNPFFKCNKYIKVLKPKQMEELYIHLCQSPDGQEIVPYTVNGNGFSGGYKTKQGVYIAAIAARVPDLMNKDYMGKAGYFNHNLMMLTYGTLSPTVWDCGSVNPIHIKLTEKNFKQFEGRFYYTSKNMGKERILKSTDTHLIGQSLWFRSPCTCNLKQDVCHLCYGTKHLKVGHLKGGFIYTTEICTSRVSQNILSAKHLLKTDAEMINIEGEGKDYFNLENSELFVADEEKRFDIFIKDNYTENISEYLDLYVTKKMLHVRISNYASLHLDDSFLDVSKMYEDDDARYYKISSSAVVNSGKPLCDVIPINIMMTANYMAILQLFENRMSSYDKIEDVVNDLNDLFVGTIPLPSVHGEIMISNHIRARENRMLRPDWRKPNPPYQMLNLKLALQNSESVATGLASEHTKAQLMQSIAETRENIKTVGPRSFIDYMLGEEML